MHSCKGILRMTGVSLASCHIVRDPHFSILDARSPRVLNRRVSKILA